MTARDLRAEEVTREFDGWMQAQGYPSPDDRYDGDEMAEAFGAGMQAQVDLDAVQRPAPVTVRSLAAALAGMRILADADDAERAGTAGGMWLVRPARPHDLAVQVLTAIDGRLTGGSAAGPEFVGTAWRLLGQAREVVAVALAWIAEHGGEQPDPETVAVWRGRAGVPS